ncbi:uncharacterized protein LOC107639710 [Arachis ipaensis]|uniref:Putative plant transposon protein domain-containing protein n=1 Tax=Arachis hypogaea TaxID=3818 RepID=A0A444ZKY8_ARAHY|nr:uncharacterized protein LOC107639710 [Arachis ipaensis]XP_020977257.1 uncharacterized protein LOC107639710 [Arachis ipaensis]XP_020977258.1 uncharacterized protein LOC107639710 [Arachis ipaensis]XP_025649023.1 uncharacterized protein LOC112743860 [Arachis hypogaea]XP_025649024.1 uncharacterized protein LOC112743860 [Arachis hypogaea]XP_029148069.1 uncharacterized protein LOC112743860 [Arachis hypogaea]QHO08168.1 uncharacterized protein DS421_14g470190 [Arachis hypogaea]RYR14822.1 hypothet
MADRKGKGKATSSGKRKRTSQSADTNDAAFYARRISGSDREAQNTPPTNKHKFSNAYSERKFETFQKRNLHVERELHIPDELSQYTDDRIAQRGWNFLGQELPTVNESWVKEFYANYFNGALDAVYLRGQQILVTEEAIKHALHLELGPSGKDAYEEAEGGRHMKTFDWDQVLAVIAEPGSQWIYGADKTTPLGIRVGSLTYEARIWQQLLSNYVMPSTHETRVTADMAVMVWCVLEGRELHLPRHIRRSMGRAHYMGNLAFPCLITQLATEAGVLWMTTDQRPTVAGHKKIIPHGDWPGLELALGRRSRRTPAPSTEARPSTSVPSASAPTDAAPPAVLQPLFSLIHQLSDDIASSERRNQRRFEQLERRSQRHYEHLRRLILSGGVDIPPELDTLPERSEEARDPPADTGADDSDKSFHSA